MWLAITISLLGAAVTTGGIFATRQCDSWTQRNIDHFISFAAGVLIAVSFIHLVPEALGLTRLAPGGFLIGYGVMHILDRFVVGYVCNRPQTERFALGLVPLVGISFHSLLDGLVYSIGFNVSTLTGLAVATGMIAHEFPEGVVIYALLRCSGFSARRSTLLAFAAGRLDHPARHGPVLFPCRTPSRSCARPAPRRLGRRADLRRRDPFAPPDSSGRA